MASFSLTEKLAVTGAFLAVVALVVGTEDDPGMVVTGQEAVKELRPVATPAPLASTAPPQLETSEFSEPSSAEPSVPDVPANEPAPIRSGT